MKRASEIIHIVPEEKREEYLRKYLNPSDKVAAVLWQCGIRKQFYYRFGGDILRTYEYTGKNFNRDMGVIANTPETADFFLKQRRMDTPEEEREKLNWWAPMRWCGSSLMNDPVPDEEEIYALDGNMAEGEAKDYTYSEDDWSESVHM